MAKIMAQVNNPRSIGQDDFSFPTYCRIHTKVINKDPLVAVLWLHQDITITFFELLIVYMKLITIIHLTRYIAVYN